MSIERFEPWYEPQNKKNNLSIQVPHIAGIGNDQAEGSQERERGIQLATVGIGSGLSSQGFESSYPWDTWRSIIGKLGYLISNWLIVSPSRKCSIDGTGARQSPY
jgi:hypothetical protein